METYEIFAFLKPGYKAISNENSKHEVFVNAAGLFYQVDDFGNPVKFLPENYTESTWKIVSV